MKALLCTAVVQYTSGFVASPLVPSALSAHAFGARSLCNSALYSAADFIAAVVSSTSV